MSRETLRKWMVKEVLWRPRRQRVKNIHVWRERRAGFGELVMQDSSPFRWFEEPPIRDPPYGRYGCGRLRVSEQGDLGAIGRAALEGGLQELPQPFGRIRLLVQFFDHRLGAALLPQVQRRLVRHMPGHPRDHDHRRRAAQPGHEHPSRR